MKENLYSNCIRTFTGNYVNVFEPKEDMICIQDIAHALSNQIRFGGHLNMPFTVAQHCIECCQLATQDYKLQALLHDASEAYLLDIPTPIKKRLTNYYEIEDNLMKLISKIFGFEYPLSEQVKQIDKVQLVYEWDNFMVRYNSNSVWPILTQKQAEDTFLALFKELT